MKRGMAFLVVFLFIASGAGFARSSKKTDAKNRPRPAEPTMSGVVNGLRFRSIGPALMSGRISDIAVHPTDPRVWYVAAGSGGVWKTVNAGTTFTPIFDRQSSYSIGCVTLDPSNPDTVWVGTGENVSGRHVGFGDGVYRSRNGGRTWERMGLEKSEHIGRILVHPGNSDVIFVAAEGPLWSSGGERGLYRSTDGGKTWTRVLFVSDETGVTDVRMEPRNPKVMYAATYQRRRSVAAFMAGGPESGIYKSTDGGETWRRLTVGLPHGDMGKIGLAVSPVKPGVVYATIEAGPKSRGFYRSADRGESWKKMSGTISGGTGPHYYQEIYADPTRLDRVYLMDVWMKVSLDGGRSFRPVGERYKHSDNHAMAFFPDHPDHFLAGCDGGLYETHDGGRTWRYFANLPLTQFYKVSVDNDAPVYHVHGGAQDNSSQLGPSRTLTRNGIRNCDWRITTGADGYASAIDPTDPNIIYAEFQNGNLFRFDRSSGEMIAIQPEGEPGETLRWNWDAPVLISPHSHTRLYFAANRLFRSDDRGNSWTPVSGDLTRNRFRLEMPMMGRTWSVDALWDHRAMSQYGTITAIAESPLEEGLLMVGTDDGLIQVSRDGGESWAQSRFPKGVPGNCFVNDIVASRHNVNRAYAALDHHKTGDLHPYLLASDDRGLTWRRIDEGLPDRTIVWSIVEDPKSPEILFLGTEFGIYVTLNGGREWIQMKNGLPTIAFRDIVIQEREDDLVCGSFGRGIYILDDISPLRALSAELVKQPATIFPVRKAWQYVPQAPLGGRGPAYQGHGYYLGENPPYGAVFTYYLKESVQSRKARRRAEEARARRDRKPVTFPGWDELKAEDRETNPLVLLTVRDADNQVVRRIRAASAAGLHRTSWDLRYPVVYPIRLQQEEEQPPWRGRRAGPMVVPGRYTVSLEQIVDGVPKQLVGPVPFEVVSLRLATLPAPDRTALLAFQQRAGRLQRAAYGVAATLNEATNRVRHLRQAVMETPGADLAMLAELEDLNRGLADLSDELYGDRTRRRRNESSPAGIFGLISTQLNATGPITETARTALSRAESRFGALQPKAKDLMKRLTEIERQLEKAGAPWTPGRGLPHWQP